MKSRIETRRGETPAPNPTLALNLVHNLTLHLPPSPFLNFSASCELDEQLSTSRRMTRCNVREIHMRPQPLIAVTDVEASSRWYQRLLGCKSDHGASHYEQLGFNGQLILQLPSFKAEPHHCRIGHHDGRPYRSRFLLCVDVDGFASVIEL